MRPFSAGCPQTYPQAVENGLTAVLSHDRAGHYDDRRYPQISRPAVMTKPVDQQIIGIPEHGGATVTHADDKKLIKKLRKAISDLTSMRDYLERGPYSAQWYRAVCDSLTEATNALEDAITNLED